MMPKTSVSPADSRNSRMPSCRPFSSWVRSRDEVKSRLLERALLAVAVRVILEDHSLVGECRLAGRVLHDVHPVVIANRKLVGVETERACNRLEIRCLERCTEALLVRQVALYPAQR